jgi:hypothetical protein
MSFARSPFNGPALLAAQRWRSLLRGTVGGCSNPRKSLMQVCDFAVFPTQLAAEADDFRLTRVAALCVEGQLLAQSLDVLNGLPISRVVGQSLLSVHHCGEPIDGRAQLIAEPAGGVSGRQAFQELAALELRTQEQPGQDVHRRGRQPRIGVGSVCAGNLDDAHRGAGVLRRHAFGRGQPSASW